MKKIESHNNKVKNTTMKISPNTLNVLENYGRYLSSLTNQNKQADISYKKLEEAFDELNRIIDEIQETV